MIPRRRTKSNQKKVGFKVQTILDHFPGYQYEMLIGKYASLGEMSECVVCLETMKPSAEYANIPTSLEEHQLMHCKDESVTSRARSVRVIVNISVGGTLHLLGDAVLPLVPHPLSVLVAVEQHVLSSLPAIIPGRVDSCQ